MFGNMSVFAASRITHVVRLCARRNYSGPLRTHIQHTALMPLGPTSVERCPTWAASVGREKSASLLA
jgi:hypothetical protein